MFSASGNLFKHSSTNLPGANLRGKTNKAGQLYFPAIKELADKTSANFAFERC
jgi:hypothetical protein